VLVLAQWLKQCGIRTVAMEATVLYWIALLQILEEEGLEVALVNACYMKNVPGRKSDVAECQGATPSFSGAAARLLPSS